MSEWRGAFVARDKTVEDLKQSFLFMRVADMCPGRLVEGKSSGRIPSRCQRFKFLTIFRLVMGRAMTSAQSFCDSVRHQKHVQMGKAIAV